MSADRSLEADLASLASLVTRVSDADRHREEPPAGLWDRIAAAALDGDAALVEATEVTAEPGLGPDQAAEPNRVLPMRPVPSRRSRRMLAVGGALALAAAAAIAIPLAVSTDDDVRVLASAPLSNEGLASFDDTPVGSARLVEDHGVRYLDVRVDDAPPLGDGYLELWLIDTQVQGMVSLGPYTGNHRYPVPASVSPERFPVVDVSLEPSDGVPTHSGVSVVRGVLPANDRSA